MGADCVRRISLARWSKSTDPNIANCSSQRTQPPLKLRRRTKKGPGGYCLLLCNDQNAQIANPNSAFQESASCLPNRILFGVATPDRMPFCFLRDVACVESRMRRNSVILQMLGRSHCMSTFPFLQIQLCHKLHFLLDMFPTLVQRLPFELVVFK